MTENFRELQRQFSAHLRDPDRQPPPAGVDDRRLQVYRELFYNTVEGLLAKSFPVLCDVLDHRAQWHPLVRDFYANARCDSPYFTELPARFVAYLADETRVALPPYAPELAHYEWLELVIEIAEDARPGPLDPDGDLLRGVPVLNPVYRVAHYHWPVSRIAADWTPDTPLASPMQVLLYRDADDTVRFVEINALTAALIAQLDQSATLSGRQQLQRLAEQLPQLPAAQILHFGAEILADFRGRGIILGTAPGN